MKALALLAAAAFAAAPAQAAYTNVWSTSFDTTEYEVIGPFPFTVLSTLYGGAYFDSSGTAPGLGTQYFRNDSGSQTIFTASGLGAHNSLKLSFDLIFANTWDSDDGTYPFTPDYLYVDYGGLASDAYTTALASGSNNYFGPGVETSVGFYLPGGAPARIVHYDLTFAHTASSFYLSLYAGGAGYQYGPDEWWGIDNFSLAAEVPEPATWAMMITGFGLAGAALRRQRALAAA